MTAPSYTEDLSDATLADESSGWVEMTGTDQDGESYSACGTPAYQDNEYPYIQGSYAVTQDTTKSTAIGSIGYNVGGISVPTDGAILVWQNYSSPFAFGSYAQGGYRIVLGSSQSDFNVWYVGGNDKGRMPYGGWENHAVNPTVTRDNYAGTHSGTINYVASAVYLVSGPSKGEPHQVDAIRYGRCSAIFEYGETSNYATVDGFALLNDAQANRWGLIQATPGGYLWKGRIQLGSSSNAVDFRDSNVTIFIDWTPKVTANFNTIEIVNSSSNIEMTGFQFICLDPSGTASKGRWITTDDADVSLDSCTFSDMNTFVFDSNTTALSCTFNRCNQITQGGATLTKCIFNQSVSGVSVVADSLGDITNCTFISDGSNHAVNLGNVSSTQSMTWNNTLTSYATSNGSTGNEAILVDVDNGVTLTINVTGGTTPYYYNTGTGSVVVVASVPITISVVNSDNVPITTAAVRLEETDGSLVKEGTVNGSGIFSDSFSGSTPLTVILKVRSSSSGETRYIPVRSSGTIASDTGIVTTITMQKDTIVGS